MIGSTGAAQSVQAQPVTAERQRLFCMLLTELACHSRTGEAGVSGPSLAHTGCGEILKLLCTLHTIWEKGWLHATGHD